jgi:hypothetical protein
MRPLSPIDLYWSLHGEVACANHAPEVEDPRWTREGWARINLRPETVQATRYEYQCQHCALDGRALVRVAYKPNTLP